MANAGDGFFMVEEPLGQPNEVGIFPDVFRGATAGEKDAEVFFRVDFGKGELGVELVTFPFLGDRPAGADFVHDHLVGAFLWGDGDWFDAGLLKSIIGVEGVECFGGVANNDQGFADGFCLHDFLWVVKYGDSKNSYQMIF